MCSVSESRCDGCWLLMVGGDGLCMVVSGGWVYMKCVWIGKST